MTKEELYKRLDLETPADFTYFEQFAEVIECDEEIPFELFLDVFNTMDAQTAGELIENYFDEFTNNLPDTTQSFFALTDAIRQRMLLLAQDIDRPMTRYSLCEELYKFREWYTNPLGTFVDGENYSILEAITMKREESFSAAHHIYDFSPSMNYEIEDLQMGIGSFEQN